MSKKKIQLSDHFDYSRLIRFVLPCIGTMLFTSIYGIVDGLCVSNFVGKTAFAAVNLIMPVPMLVGTVGFMLGTGGSAIDAITQIKKHGAKRIKFIGLIAAPEGIKALHEAHPDVDIYLGAEDDHLNENGYIVPGLGDAGDRIYGTK